MFTQLGLPSWVCASIMGRTCSGSTSSNRKIDGASDLDHIYSSEQAQAIHITEYIIHIKVFGASRFSQVLSFMPALLLLYSSNGRLMLSHPSSLNFNVTFSETPILTLLQFKLYPSVNSKHTWFFSFIDLTMVYLFIVCHFPLDCIL